MKIKTHLILILSIILFFSTTAILQELFCPIKFHLLITNQSIMSTFPREILPLKSDKDEFPSQIAIDNQTFSICQDFKEMNREIIEKQLFLKVKVNCSCGRYFLERFTRVKLTQEYKLYSIESPYSFTKEGNDSILSFKINYEISRLNQKANILCMNPNINSSK